MSSDPPPCVPPWVIRPLVPEEVYTDRQEHLEALHGYALNAIRRRTMSTVLLGQRRMGKTEIFKRVVNRLFFEQEHYSDPSASVVPVYYSFPDRAMDRWEFCLRYVENFLRWYTAFRLRDTKVLSKEFLKTEVLIEFVKEKIPWHGGIEGPINLFEALEDRGVTIPEEWTLMMPRRVSDWDESTIVMFLDEFQNTRLPQYNFDIVGFFHESVESPTCPHIVTGSAMSTLGREILGRGSLFGRFRARPIEPMTRYWGAELTLKAARYYEAELPESMAPVVADHCGGNPFYITAVVRQAAEQRWSITSEETLDKLLAVDLSSGFIWGELSDQVNRWIERVNDHDITKWVLYLSALEEEERIDLGRIQRALREREGKDVSLDAIRDTLVKLSRGDLVEYLELGGWFRKVKDPILVDFLRVWGRSEVEGRSHGDVTKDLLREHKIRERRIRDHVGYLGEVYLAQVLWNCQSVHNRELPGDFFHQEGTIEMPWHWDYIRHRIRLGAGTGMEIDVEASSGPEMWICESKWWRGRKVGRDDIETLVRKAELVRAKEGEGLQLLRIWFFGHDGFTEDAEALMREHGIFWSDRDDLNGLLTRVGLRTLPVL